MAVGDFIERATAEEVAKRVASTNVDASAPVEPVAPYLVHAQTFVDCLAEMTKLCGRKIPKLAKPSLLNGFNPKRPSLHRVEKPYLDFSIHNFNKMPVVALKYAAEWPFAAEGAGIQNAAVRLVDGQITKFYEMGKAEIPKRSLAPSIIVLFNAEGNCLIITYTKPQIVADKNFPYTCSSAKTIKPGELAENLAQWIHAVAPERLKAFAPLLMRLEASLPQAPEAATSPVVAAETATAPAEINNGTVSPPPRVGSGTSTAGKRAAFVEAPASSANPA